MNGLSWLCWKEFKKFHFRFKIMIIAKIPAFLHYANMVVYPSPCAEIKVRILFRKQGLRQDSEVASAWSTIDANLKHSWHILKPCLGQTWHTFEAYVYHAWSIPAKYLNNIWLLRNNEIIRPSWSIPNHINQPWSSLTILYHPWPSLITLDNPWNILDFPWSFLIIVDHPYTS